MLAICTIRVDPAYRRDAFISGLKRAGYTLADSGAPKSKEDVLCIWNRYGPNEARADGWEAQGGSVLVAENGYIGKDELGRQYYALAVHGHNGSGWFPLGDEDRFAKLGIPLLPWVSRPDGYVLVCEQRGIGSRSMASPPNWHGKAAMKFAQRRINIRPHPGNKPPIVPLEYDLAKAERCVVWSSAAGVKALTLGVPVQYDAPHWICEIGASPMLGELKHDDEARLAAMQKMAWAQWSVVELEGGEPFVRIREQIVEAKW